MDDELRQRYQDELESLEHFRMSWSAGHPGVGLDRDDPDVRRLIEALAFFSARTKDSAAKTAVGVNERLLSQHFSWLLDPSPASAMLLAHASVEHTHVEELERGTEVVLTKTLQPMAGQADTESVRAKFRFKRAMTLAPLEFERVYLKKRRGQGPQLEITIVPLAEIRSLPGTLRLHVDHLGELFSSMQIFQNFREHAVGMVAELDGERLADVSLDFGFGPLAARELDYADHPIQLFRSFLRLPEQDMFLRVDLPPHEGTWGRLVLTIDLDDGWPERLNPGRESFHLHAVPIENLHREPADPIEVDGTRDRYPLRHPEPGENYRLASVIGVAGATDDGLKPMNSGVLGTDEWSYEVERSGTQMRQRSFLSAQIKDAFMEPRLVSVEALWHQPIVSEWGLSGFTPELWSRRLGGVNWSTAQAIAPAHEAQLRETPSAMLRLIALKTQEFLSADDLRFLLDVLGAEESRLTRGLAARFRRLSFDKRPSGTSMTGFIYSVKLELEQLDAEQLLSLKILAPQLLNLLRNWGNHEVTQLVINVPSEGLTLIEKREEEQ